MVHMDKNIENEMGFASPLKGYVGIYKFITQQWRIEWKGTCSTKWTPGIYGELW